MRLILLTLVALFLLIQYPLWFGQGGWLSVQDLKAKVSGQQAANEGLRQRNLAMEAEVEDLRSGTEAVEERARKRPRFATKRRGLRANLARRCATAL